VAHPVDLVVDERVLLDVGVRLRDVGLGLVVVVVGDEVLDRVLREERLELSVQLGGRCRRSMTDATVNVLPDPVTPRRVVWGRPVEIQSASRPMAPGWSPLGV